MKDLHFVFGCVYVVISKHKKLLRLFLYPFVKGIFRHYKYKYGISISFNSSIGEGFYIGHFGGIFLNTEATIGRNCNISQGRNYWP